MADGLLRHVPWAKRSTRNETPKYIRWSISRGGNAGLSMTTRSRFRSTRKSPRKSSSPLPVDERSSRIHIGYRSTCSAILMPLLLLSMLLFLLSPLKPRNRHDPTSSSRRRLRWLSRKRVRSRPGRLGAGRIPCESRCRWSLLLLEGHRGRREGQGVVARGPEVPALSTRAACQRLLHEPPSWKKDLSAHSECRHVPYVECWLCFSRLM